MLLYIPKNYIPSLDSEKMELAIKQLKDDFQAELTHQLNLRRVTAPLFVLSGTELMMILMEQNVQYHFQ